MKNNNNILSISSFLSCPAAFMQDAGLSQVTLRDNKRRGGEA